MSGVKQEKMGFPWSGRNYPGKNLSGDEHSWLEGRRGVLGGVWERAQHEEGHL